MAENLLNEGRGDRPLGPEELWTELVRRWSGVNFRMRRFIEKVTGVPEGEWPDGWERELTSMTCVNPYLYGISYRRPTP